MKLFVVMLISLFVLSGCVDNQSQDDSEDNITPLLHSIGCEENYSKACEEPYSCEGKTIDIEGYTIRFHYVSGSILLVNYGDEVPKTYEEWEKINGNGKHSRFVKVLPGAFGSGEFPTDDYTPIKIIVKDAVIVGNDYPIMGPCNRGLSFQADASNIYFEQIPGSSGITQQD